MEFLKFIKKFFIRAPKICKNCQKYLFYSNGDGGICNQGVEYAYKTTNPNNTCNEFVLHWKFSQNENFDHTKEIVNIWKTIPKAK